MKPIVLTESQCKILNDLKFVEGEGTPVYGTACIMSAISLIEKIDKVKEPNEQKRKQLLAAEVSDWPICVCPILRHICMSTNDLYFKDNLTRKTWALKTLPKVMNTAYNVEAQKKGMFAAVAQIIKSIYKALDKSVSAKEAVFKTPAAQKNFKVLKRLINRNLNVKIHGLHSLKSLVRQVNKLEELIDIETTSKIDLDYVSSLLRELIDLVTSGFRGNTDTIGENITNLAGVVRMKSLLGNEVYLETLEAYLGALEQTKVTINNEEEESVAINDKNRVCLTQ